MSKIYSGHTEQRVRQAGFTDLIVLSFAPTTGFASGDFSGGFAVTVNLNSADLAVGDIVMDAMMEIITPVTGPTGTPTGSLGVTGAATQFTAAKSVIAAAQQVVGSAFVPYVVAATGKRLVIGYAVGGGDGAVATAGEIWCWFKIWRAADRAIQA